ncbi:hypothetical protein L484_016387 [Morus notabilis]|uniref:Uncharacterized protein n=1 Tax=Morus notabilis TaxID=981085 RepID=W9RYS8_9ROSA|nr:hypothetical protein L484_016387 [Morus notabilis]
MQIPNFSIARLVRGKQGIPYKNWRQRMKRKSQRGQLNSMRSYINHREGNFLELKGSNGIRFLHMRPNLWKSLLKKMRLKEQSSIVRK